LMLFWAASALLLWYLAHRRISPIQNGAASVGLAIVIAAGMYSHYYGAVTIVPIAVAELFRAIQYRQLNKPIIIATIVGASAGAGLLPLVVTARTFSAGFWRRPSLSDLEMCYGTILVNFAIPLFLVSAVAYFSRGINSRIEARKDLVADIAAISF